MSDSENPKILQGSPVNPLPAKFFAKYGIFTGILIVMLGFLICFSLLSRSSWENGLRKTVQKTLEASGESYVAGESVPLGSALSISACAFQLEGELQEQSYAVIIRVATLYGPLPAVFVWTSGDETARFVSFASLSGKAAEKVYDSAQKSQLNYWSQRIPGLFPRAEEAPAL